MFKNKEKKPEFNEKNIDKLLRLARKDLLKPILTKHYTQEEIDEAKRRYEIEKANQPEPTVLDMFNSKKHIATPKPKPVIPSPEEQDDDCSNCTLI